MSLSSFTFQPIGYIKSPFADRFGVPRQPGLADEAKGVIQLLPQNSLQAALKSLDQFSHLWIVFVFHDHGGHPWKPTIRPPRLGGNKKVGVLASRSPHRPNPLGISAVKISKINLDHPDGPQIEVEGIDLIDGTPVLDIKPYIPYADSIPEATSGWAADPIPRYQVIWSEQAQKELAKLHGSEANKVNKMITEVLELDPRPAFQKRKHPVTDEKSWGLQYGFDVGGNDVKYELKEGSIFVYRIRKLHR